MKIIASPARAKKELNPFTYLLSEALAAEGCEVIDFTFRLGLFQRCDILHLHWPQPANRSLYFATKKALLLGASLLSQRLRGARIVWTVHNVHAHDQHHIVLERMFMWFFARILHGVIFLSASSQKAAYREIPALAAKPFAIIPHGLYGQVSKASQAAARVLFGLPSTGHVVGFLGDIKRYKGLDLLLEAWEQTLPGQITVFIAGTVSDADHRSEIQTRLSRLGERGFLCVFLDKRLDHAALTDAIRACDLVTLPYRAIWNSGLAMLVLENRVRILANEAPIFRELQQEIGREWVEVVDGPWNGETLCTVVNNVNHRQTEHMATFSPARSWPEIAMKTVAFYRRLGAGQTAAKYRPRTTA